MSALASALADASNVCTLSSHLVHRDSILLCALLVPSLCSHVHSHEPGELSCFLVHSRLKRGHQAQEGALDCKGSAHFSLKSLQRRAYTRALRCLQVHASCTPFAVKCSLLVHSCSLVHVSTVQARRLPSLHESALDGKGSAQGVHCLACCPCVRGHSLARERAYIRGACQCTG